MLVDDLVYTHYVSGYDSRDISLIIKSSEKSLAAYITSLHYANQIL